MTLAQALKIWLPSLVLANLLTPHVSAFEYKGVIGMKNFILKSLATVLFVLASKAAHAQHNCNIAYIEPNDGVTSLRPDVDLLKYPQFKEAFAKKGYKLYAIPFETPSYGIDEEDLRERLRPADLVLVFDLAGGQDENSPNLEIIIAGIEVKNLKLVKDNTTPLNKKDTVFLVKTKSIPKITKEEIELLEKELEERQATLRGLNQYMYFYAEMLPAIQLNIVMPRYVKAMQEALKDLPACPGERK